ncbi:hypothetical protein MAP00_007060 [Monascus purpureus]|nr:hypothetical protein MAP00_007060 [Monascus purpureus]
MTTTSLRAVTHRLTTTPVQDLPPIASFLATSIGDCAELLATPQGSSKNAKSESENAAQIHKLKTRLTSLLQDRSFEGRWTAVVLVKAAVEAGQWEILRGCEPLVRGMISILGKPDPISTKKMSIITLTRIFHLTYQYQTLVREITTPSLPGFITATLNLVSVKPSSEPVRKLRPSTPLMETVLHALVSLIARHPTIFRPFSAQIHSVVLAILGASPMFFPESVVGLAQQLFIALHNCAPKNTMADQWREAIKLTISSAHRTADRVFRAVVEQWESVDASLRHTGKPQSYDQEVGDHGPDPMGLAGWRGLHSGAERLVVLLRLLSGFLSTPTASTVPIPLGYILDLTSRLTSVTVPTEAADAAKASVQLNLQIGREERDALWSELSRIHAACVDIFTKAVDSLGTALIPVAQTMLEQTLWVFCAEKFSRELRTVIYGLIRRLLLLIGPSMSKQGVSNLTRLLRTCCSDILCPAGEPRPSASESKGKSKTNQASVNADSFLNGGSEKGQNQARTSSSFPDLFDAASALLPAVLNFVPTENLPVSIRSEIDRTVILTADKNGMLASVLNPMPVVKGRAAAPSIMPFLARNYPDEMEVESLIRPRMPLLMNVGGYIDQVEEGEEDEEDEVESSVPTHGAVSIDTELPKYSDPSSQHPATKTDNEPSQAPSKRNYTEEPGNPFHITSATVPDSRAETEIQTKKVRLDDDNLASSTATQQSQSGSDKLSTISVSLPSAPAAAPQSSNTIPSNPLLPQSSLSWSGASGIAKSEAEGAAPRSRSPIPQFQGEEGSDDELPTLNVDPDTEDDEEDDVNMEG